MNVARLLRLAAVASVGLLVTSSAEAQIGLRPGSAYPAPQPGYVYRRPAYPVYRPAPRIVSQRPAVMPHVGHYRDWTTGRENLPLAKPWLHSSR